MKWVRVNTYRYIFSGINIHLPAILGFTRYEGFDPSPNEIIAHVIDNVMSYRDDMMYLSFCLVNFPKNHCFVLDGLVPPVYQLAGSQKIVIEIYWNDHLIKMSIEIATHSRRKRWVRWVCRFWAHMTRDLPFTMTTGTEAQKVLERVSSWRGGDGYGSKTQRTGVFGQVWFQDPSGTYMILYISRYLQICTSFSSFKCGCLMNFLTVWSDFEVHA